MDAEALDGLRPLLGLWRTSGHVLERTGGREATIAGTDEYELMEGGRWVIHRVDVLMGDVRTVALELIGDPDGRGALAMRAFDASGRYDEMRLAPTGEGVLLLTGDGVRSTLRLTGADAMDALWERQAGGDWAPWMQLHFERIR